MKKFATLFILLLLLPFVLNAATSCNFAIPFLNTLKGKDFLHYKMEEKLLPYFYGAENIGQGKISPRRENFYTFLIKTAWKWRKLGISSSILKDYKIEKCDVEEDSAEVTVRLYFHYFLFFTKSFTLTIPFRKTDKGWKVDFPPLSQSPLK